MNCFSVLENDAYVFRVTPRSHCLIGLALTISGRVEDPFYQIGANCEGVNGLSDSITWLKNKLSLGTKLQIRRENNAKEIWPNDQLPSGLNGADDPVRGELLAKLKIGSSKERFFHLDCPCHFIVTFGEPLETNSSLEYHLSFFGRKSSQDNLTYLLDEDLQSEDQIEIVLMDVPLNQVHDLTQQ